MRKGNKDTDIARRLVAGVMKSYDPSLGLLISSFSNGVRSRVTLLVTAMSYKMTNGVSYSPSLTRLTQVPTEFFSTSLAVVPEISSVSIKTS